MSAARFAKIVGTGSALPRNVVSNAALAEKLAAQGVETSDSWIVERTGIRQRHIAALEVTSSELGTQAALAALQAAGMQAKDIDLIICATSTPDFVFPSTACLIQAKLGVAGGAAFDVQAVCSGFAYAMATADAYIRTGLANNALVIGSEVFSRILDWNDRTTCVLFGDGAGAVVLAASESPGILASRLHADGSQQHILRTAGNVCSGAIVGHPFLTMDGQAVFKLAVRVLDEVAREVVTAAGMQLEQIDWLIPHQANVRILSATAKKLGLPESKTIVTVDQHANTSAASIPLALDLAVRDGRIRPGHHVLMEGVGGGFTWGAVLARM
ncbi:beta-ketoacyl-ACP synthase III [Piscinibacterium candidicorallinum]|uniref:Beta-ketoacyl-[acyl-carrier-protein] synthase III n=1 Tax=Piscinibacterium candidicorallinum TaxID=1793872 RepID=A0ABV7GZG7_9BURK